MVKCLPQTLAFSSCGKKALLFYSGLEAPRQLSARGSLSNGFTKHAAPALPGGGGGGVLGLATFVCSVTWSWSWGFLLSRIFLPLSSSLLSFPLCLLIRDFAPHLSEVSCYSWKGQFAWVCIRVHVNKIYVEMSQVGCKFRCLGHVFYLFASAAFLWS